MTRHTLFATCPRGLENILAQEMQQHGAGQIAPAEGGVSCQGSLETAYRLNLHSRTASRILLQLACQPYRSEDDLYRLAKNIRWEDWFHAGQTFKIKAEGKRARVKSLDFTALKIKDGLCDRFRSSQGQRPSVNKASPDIRIHAFLSEQHAALFIDTSGEALFKRGYRQEAGEAPLRENLAAGLLLLAGYNGSQPFQDPFCGSGTLPIEAALIATRRAPGLHRPFGFENLANFDADLWQLLRQEAQAAILPQAPAPIAGSDNLRHMIQTAAANAREAQVADHIIFQVADVHDTRPNGENGILLSNPPYGVRLEEIQTLHALYPQLGSWLKQHYPGWLCGLFTADRDMPKLMRLTPKRKIPLYNGKLDCRLFLLDMVRGSHRTPKAGS
ncbi:class I SAM-dependent RNA methyltransferase [Eikenella sp. Marseille-P7795]|uniref:THUMP domain-containing class I SAM-dependent RNA methyltransferase n=1 Tax=Eikenella sp. Marseille-P7795 TaxID=2866577 RepID=UPI001CE472DD|nr:class I SAM-dependent RNA methyltransferase [Eikenella sp. Marseille-P7795]